jgi:hypothetical protein
VGTELATERQVGTDELNLEAGKDFVPLTTVGLLRTWLVLCPYFSTYEVYLSCTCWNGTSAL